MNVPSEASIIYDVQTSSAIDAKYHPVELTNTFLVQQTVYVTYKISSNGQEGYVQVKWNNNDQPVRKGPSHPPLKISAGVDHGFSSHQYDAPTNGTAEVYWCTTVDCSDAQLAAAVHFTVTELTTEAL